MPNSHPKLTPEGRYEAALSAARCRASRKHRLDPIPTPPGAPQPQFGAMLTERCETCGTIRYAIVSRITGELLSPYRYDHPDWYEEALYDKHDPNWWRKTWWSTLDPDLFHESAPTATVTPIKRKRRKTA